MVLLGIVPVLIDTPPIAACFSTTATRFPAFAPWMAARCPPGPEPTTIKSYGCIRRVQRAFLFRGAIRRGVHGRRSINDALFSQRGNVRRVATDCGQPHEMILRGESVPIAH